MSGELSAEYRATAAAVLAELERTLGHGLDESEKFMFVHGTAECKLPELKHPVCKDAEKSLAARQRAEELIEVCRFCLLHTIVIFTLQAVSWQDALAELNAAVLLAPAAETEDLSELAAALLLRSRALLALGHPLLALRRQTIALLTVSCQL